MPILTLQRRLREVGRIRIGQKVPTGNGKQRPAKLTTFRLTSQDQQVIEAAATLYGGDARKWADAPAGADQWEVITEATVLPVIVPPSEMSFSQFFELWSGGGCQRRCDGQWEFLGDRACVCDPDAMECSPHTRVSVMLRDLPGLGVWRLDTQGYYAATELAGAVEVCQAVAARGQMLPARLRLEQRMVKREGEQPKRFAVPVLDVDVTIAALTAGRPVDAATGEIDGTAPLAELEPAERPALRPVPVDDLPPGPQPTVAEQMGTRPTPVARKNAAAPIPSTGVKPRTAAAAESGGSARVCVRCTQPLGTAPIVKEGGGYAHKECPDGDATEPEPEPTEDVAPEPEGEWEPSEAKITALAKQAFASAYDGAAHGQKTKTLDRLRYALTWVLTGGSATSMNDLDAGRKRELLDWLGWVRDGRVAWDVDDDGVTFTLVGSDRGPVHVDWSAFEDAAEPVAS